MGIGYQFSPITPDSVGSTTIIDGSIKGKDLDPEFNLFFPEDYGAVGDGSTDDSAAIQAAIDAAEASNGGKVKLKGLVYAISSSLELKQYVLVEGVSPSATAVKRLGNFNIFNNTASPTDVGLRNLKLDGGSAAYTASLILLDSCWQITLENIKTLSDPSSNPSLYLSNCYYGTLKNVFISSSYAGLFATGCANIIAYSVIASNCTYRGIEIAACFGMSWNDLNIQGCAVGLYNTASVNCVIRGYYSNNTIGVQDTGVCTGTVYEIDSTDDNQQKDIQGTGSRYIDLDAGEDLGFITPEQFGAVGDGTTDDISAFNNAVSALQALGGGIIKLDKKTYAIGSQLLIAYPNINIIGAGREFSKIKALSGSSANIVFASITKGLLQDFTFDVTDNAISCFFISTCDSITLRRLTILNGASSNVFAFEFSNGTNCLAEDIAYPANCRISPSNSYSTNRGMNINNSLSFSDAGIELHAGNDNNTNGDMLVDAYAIAKFLLPNESALATTNRQRITLFPGTYNVDDGSFILDTNYIDIVGAGGADNVRVMARHELFMNGQDFFGGIATDDSALDNNKWYIVAPGATGGLTGLDFHAIHAGVGNTFSDGGLIPNGTFVWSTTTNPVIYKINITNNTIDVAADPSTNVIPAVGVAVRQTATDVIIEGITIGNNIVTQPSNDTEYDPAAYFPDSNLSSTVLKDIVFSSAGYWGTRVNVDYSGKYENCRGVYIFRLASNASGIFKDCKSEGDRSFANLSGQLINCQLASYLILLDGAIVYNCIITGTNSGESIQAAGAINAAISECVLAGPINVNVTNTALNPHNSGIAETVGSSLVGLNASNLASGTVPLARLSGITDTEISNSAAISVSKLGTGGTIPANSGANLTALNASNLASGTVPLARISGITNNEIDAAAAIAVSKLGTGGAIPANSGVNLTALNASNLGSGTVPDARLSANVPVKSNGVISTGIIIENALSLISGSETSLTTNTNNYNPNNHKAELMISSDSSINLTGLDPSGWTAFYPTNPFVHCTNYGSNPIIFKNEDANSTNVNRFLTSTGLDVTLNSGESAFLLYDNTTLTGTSKRWRVFKLGGTSGADASGSYVVGGSANAPTNAINIPILASSPLKKAASPNAYDDYFEANASGWTAGNSATISWANGMMTVTGAASSQNQFREAYKTLPATPYTITTLVYLTRSSVANYHQAGVFLGDGTKLIVLVLQDAAGQDFGTLYLKKFTNANNGTQSSFSVAYDLVKQDHIYFRVSNDGTDIKFDFSFEGVRWFNALTEPKATYLGTIDRFGIVANSANAGETAMALCPFVKLTSP